MQHAVVLIIHTGKAETRRCSRCEKKDLQCARAKVYMIESDKEACNKKALLNLCSEGGILHKHAFVIFGVQHALKSAAGPLFNWCGGCACDNTSTFAHFAFFFCCTGTLPSVRRVLGSPSLCGALVPGVLERADRKLVFMLGGIDCASLDLSVKD